MNKIAAADGINLVTDSHAESGWTWHLHAESQETLEKIRSRAWDTVILQVSETFGAQGFLFSLYRIHYYSLPIQALCRSLKLFTFAGRYKH